MSMKTKTIHTPNRLSSMIVGVFGVLMPVTSFAQEQVSGFFTAEVFHLGSGLMFVGLFVWGIFLLLNKRKHRQTITYLTNQLREFTEEKSALLDRLRKRENEMKEVEFRAHLLEHLDSVVVVTNKNGQLEWVNKRFEVLYEYTFEEFGRAVGENIYDISTNPRAISEGVEQKKAITYPSYRITKDGRKIWLQVGFTPILDEKGEILKFVFVETDVSLYKISESEILQQRDEVDSRLTITEIQRDKMEAKFKIFTESVNYAQRIQNAIFSSKEALDRILGDYFIHYKPRDIVSGDFYWVAEKDNKKIIVVADCTGHGVPGAFMSILGITFLTDAVNKCEHLRPSEILNELRTLVISAFAKSQLDEETKDGIDMTLLVIDEETKELQFSGANSPMYYIRERDLKVIRGDRMPIGNHPKADQSFTNHTIQLLPGDMIYLFTDGYADQFGWRNGKKFKYQQFRRLILELYDIPMRGQQMILENTIANWMGELEQVDDILVMGFKI